MNTTDPKYLEDCFIVRKADYDGYDRREFSELVDVKAVTIESINTYFGEYEVANSLEGSIIYKCTPVFIIETKTVLKPLHPH